MHTSFYRRAASVLCVFALLSASACSNTGREGRTEGQAVAGRETNASIPAENISTPELARGKQVYEMYCLACHQTNGQGVPGLYPPIARSEWVDGDRDRLIGVILNGLEGPIEVRGETYNQAMPPHNFLSNEQVANVLTYIRMNFGNDAPAISPEEVEAVRSAR
jgi:mono/diheme cytochrome c family protein